MDRLFGVALALLPALALAYPASAQAGGKLRIAVEGGCPPFGETAADGTTQGFDIDIDIDITNAACVRRQVECQQVEAGFDAMTPALRQAGRVLPRPRGLPLRRRAGGDHGRRHLQAHRRQGLRPRCHAGLGRGEAAHRPAPGDQR
jgi:hypothetical protein